MQLLVLTIFPELFAGFWQTGMIRRAVDQGAIHPRTVDIRAYTDDRHHTTDDRPYGGGPGMVMKPEPLARALTDARTRAPDARIVLLSPQGRRLNQAISQELAALPGLILLCGRYEGVDERIVQTFVADEISIGDYVLSGGEVAAMVVMEAVTRLLPGVLGNAASAQADSFEHNLLDHAQFTRPPEFNGDLVPEVLLSGDHQAIAAWRLEDALQRTFLKRPDLFADRCFSREEIRILKRWIRHLEEIVRGQSDPEPGALSGTQ